MISDKLTAFISRCITNFDSISKDRKLLLDELSLFVQNRKNESSINLIFVCTHNSRRSHLSQVWAQVAAHYYGTNNVNSYSGGTEATAIFPVILDTLKSTGFEIEKLSAEDSSIYALKYSENEMPIIGFSKEFNHAFNPKNDFAAVMTCTDADENCPLIPNSTRISLPYNDPKVFDNTPEQESKYRERSEEIATELFYAFSKINP